MKSDLKHCPTCGSEGIRRVKKPWRYEEHGHTWVVPDVDFDECPQCGEKVFDREAVRKIQQKSWGAKHAGRKAA